MTLQQLEYLSALEQTRHFGRAADICGVSQPTLSAMIQKLEEELGAKLFERTARKVCPTDMGLKVVAKAREILSNTEEIRHIVSTAKNEIGGTFRLGILPTIAPYLLPRFFPRLCNDFPHLDLRATELKTEELKAALQNHEIDAAIMVNIGDLADFKTETLYYEQFLAYVSKKDELFQHQNIKTTDLSNKALWLLDEGHCFRDQLVRFCHLKSAQRSTRTYTLGSIETFMRIVEAGGGVTFIPELALLQLTPEQKELVRPFALPIPVREIVLVRHSSDIRFALIRLMAERVRSCVPPQMLKADNTKMRL